MIAPFIGYSQKLPTKTLKPISFTYDNDIPNYTFNFDQTRYFYETKLLYDICVKKNHYADSLIQVQAKVIQEVKLSNSYTNKELDTCAKLVDKQISQISKQDSLLGIQQKKLNKKNMAVSFLTGTTLSLALFLIFAL
jgi:flagellin-like hook-associated protein FlgL